MGGDLSLEINLKIGFHSDSICNALNSTQEFADQGIQFGLESGGSFHWLHLSTEEGKLNSVQISIGDSNQSVFSIIGLGSYNRPDITEDVLYIIVRGIQALKEYIGISEIPTEVNIANGMTNTLNPKYIAHQHLESILLETS